MSSALRQVTTPLRTAVSAVGARRTAFTFNTTSAGFPEIAPPSNEPVHTFEPESEERQYVLEALAELRSAPLDVPVVINGEEIFTDNVHKQVAPSDHQHVVANVSMASKEHLQKAIDAAVAARREWDLTPFEHRAAVFLKTADLLSTKYRYRLLAANMLGQGKTVHQAEIDATCETIDFFRFGTKYAEQLYAQQPPAHSPLVWNRLVYRALEGFVAAIAPFNFTAIGANIAGAPALMGNAVLWKPALTAALSNYVVFDVMREAGLPDGVVNFVPCHGPDMGEVVTKSPDLAAINFTGSTGTFNRLWKGVAANLDSFKTYPRIVGECGGKNFHILHPTADVDSAVISTIRSAFEYQGQKCSACSRIYVPESLWPDVRKGLVDISSQIKMGQPDDLSNFMSAVIDKASFDNLREFIEDARQRGLEFVTGGGTDDSKGYFVEPTIIRVSDPKDKLMETELFGPVLAAYVYPDDDWSNMLRTVNATSQYGLTGSVFAVSRAAIEEALIALRGAAGNFYINDKSTGSVVGQQPFGGARRSGTNDKAGSAAYLLRFTSMQSIKECLGVNEEWRYPHMD